MVRLSGTVHTRQSNIVRFASRSLCIMSGLLKGRVAVVTGGSRGIGRGVALGLGQAGAIVYVTGRTLEDGGSIWPGSISSTAREITGLGGRGIAVRCDHRNDSEVESLFKRVRDEQNRLDILVNNATSFGETPTSRGYDPEEPFWTLPIKQWDEMIGVGLRSYYVASVFAAQTMTHAEHGVLVNISSGGATQFAGNVAYGVGKAGVDKLSADMAHQLRQYKVASISIWPPLTRTEKVLAHKDHYDLQRSYSPLFTGEAVAALVADPNIMEKTGRSFRVTDLAKEYGVFEQENPPAETAL
jgi:dehydrogenase/reductase SDR family member 1